MRWVAPLLAYSLFALLLTQPLLFHLTTAIPNDIGDPLLNSWILAWVSQALLVDPLNLFNANIFHPLPNTLAYSEHLVSTALLIFPLQLAYGEPILSYNLSLWLTFPLSAYGMYLLTLRWTAQRSAALIAGFIFGFAPYRFAAIAHLQLLTFQWIPFTLLFFDYLIFPSPHSSRPKRVMLGLVLCLVGQILTAWYLAIYTFIILGAYGIMLIGVYPRQLFTVRRVVQLLVIGGITICLILPFAWPYLSLVEQLRNSRPLFLALSIAAHPTDFLAAAPFNRLFGPLSEPFRYRPNFTEENALFLGGIAPILAVIAGLTVLPRQPWRVGAALMIFSLTLTLTFATPYAWVASWIPSATIIRVPPRWIIPAIFALAVLAAYGYRYLHRQPLISRRPYTLFTLTILLLMLETISTPLPLAAVDNHRSLNPAYHWLAEQSEPLILLELPMYRDPEYPEVKRMAASTVGWWRLVNGYSGYLPPRHHELALALESFPAQTALTAIQKLAQADARPFYLLVHPGEAPFDRSYWEETQRWQVESQPDFTPVGTFAGDYLYRVNINRTLAPPSSYLATFANQIQLLNVELLEPDPAQPEAHPRLLLHWQTTAMISEDYTVFVHLRAEDGFVLAQADGPPVNGHQPTSQWPLNQTIQDIRRLPSLSTYHQVAIGLYNLQTGERLSAVGADNAALVDNALVITLPD